MKWIQRQHKQRDFTYKFTEPEKSDDYWVTDGWEVVMAHYDKESDCWGIYDSNKTTGIIRHCYAIDDMNFNIAAWCEMRYPKVPEKFQNL